MDWDRKRLENYIKGRLPDSYWRLVCKHQGSILSVTVEMPRRERVNFGVLLLVNSMNDERENYSYCVDFCFDGMQGYYPERILPFSDDTGGNYFAFDFRENPDVPSIAFVDHEIQGEGGIIHVASNFDLFMAALIARKMLN